MKTYIIRIFMFIFIYVLIAPIPIKAIQDQIKNIITIRLINGMEYLEDTNLFEQFEADNPGIAINIIYADISESVFPSPSATLEEHLAAVDQYTISADILIAGTGTRQAEVSPQATQSGYFLDLSPLVRADPTFYSDEFYPAVWQAVNWDNGIWLLPVAGQLELIVYNPSAFDNAGISYPSSSWSIDEYIHAIEAITPRDPSGQAKYPGFIGFNGGDLALWYSLLNHGLVDSTQRLSAPLFNQEDVIAFAEQWTRLYESGAAYNPAYLYSEFNSPESIPLTVDRVQTASYNDHVALAMLPGDKGSISITGLAISSRTSYPESAYNLVKFLSADQRFVDAVKLLDGMSISARSVYPEIDIVDSSPYLIENNFSSEQENYISSALIHSISPNDTRYMTGFQEALYKATNENIPVEIALQEMQYRLELDQENIGIAISGNIPTPFPDQTLAPNKIELSFRVFTFNQSFDEVIWLNFIQTFIANDPQIAQVNLEFRTSFSLEETTETSDCFYLPYNAVPQLNLGMLLPLDPLITTDINTDVSSWGSGIQAQLQREQSIWAYPLDMQPEVIWYDPSVLSNENILSYKNNWSIDSFENILENVQTANNASFGSPRLGTSLLMLIAAYDGLPINYQTTPVTIDFVGNVHSIRQVLDLAKMNLIAYSPLVSSGIGNFGNQPFVVDTFSINSLGFRTASDLPLLFPHGNRFTPISYDLGSAYISRFSSSPEGCYRFISQLSQHPELLMGIPVRQQGHLSEQIGLEVNLIEFYNEFQRRLQESNIVVFPLNANNGSVSDFVLQYWLFRAFDRYILHNADLENELNQAEILTREYLLCNSSIPVIYAQREYNRLVIECAIRVDPETESFFLNSD